MVTSVVVEQPPRSDRRARPSFKTARTLQTESGEVCSQITTASMSETPFPKLFRAKTWITRYWETLLSGYFAGLGIKNVHPETCQSDTVPRTVARRGLLDQPCTLG
ncbi:MAG: hypothetical protein ABSH52_10865 [Terriglobia bacterium]